MGGSTNNPGAGKHGQAGWTQFQQDSTAGNATISALGGKGDPGHISFYDTSSGGTARIRLSTEGLLDISPHTAPGVTIGSLEGNGKVTIGALNLTVGSNNASTVYNGSITDVPLGGDNLRGSLTLLLARALFTLTGRE